VSEAATVGARRTFVDEPRAAAVAQRGTERGSAGEARERRPARPGPAPAASRPEESLSLVEEALRLSLADMARRVIAQLDASLVASAGVFRGRPTTPLRARTALFSVMEEEIGGSVANEGRAAWALLMRQRERLAELEQTGFTDARLARRLSTGLAAAAVAADTVRWHTTVAVSIYEYYLVGQDYLGTLRNAWLVYAKTVTLPVMVAAEKADTTGDRRVLVDALEKAEPRLASWRSGFEAYQRLFPAAAALTRKIMAAIYAAECAWAVWKGLLGILRGPPIVGGGGGGMAVATAAGVAIRLPIGIAVDWGRLLQTLGVLGGVSAHVVLSSGGASGALGGGSAASPDDERGGEERGERGEPQPAPDDLYVRPRGARQAAAWERQDEAAAQIIRESVLGKAWSSFPMDLRRRFGFWAMRQIYPPILQIYRGGRGLIFKGGDVTPQFIRALKGKTNRAAFIETAVQVPGGRPIRPDLFEVDFLAGTVEVGDITTSFQRAHLAKTGRYGRVLFETLGLSPIAKDIVLTDGEKVLDWLLELHAP
jgi:hypothetical protein